MRWDDGEGEQGKDAAGGSVGGAHTSLWRTGSRKSAAAPAPAALYQRPNLAGGWMGEALEGGCGLVSSAGLTTPGVPPALTPSAGFAERCVFGFHLFTCRGAGPKMLREGASLPATQPGTAQHGTGAAVPPRSREHQAIVPPGQAATGRVTRATVIASPRWPLGHDVQLHRGGEEEVEAPVHIQLTQAFLAQGGCRTHRSDGEVSKEENAEQAQLGSYRSPVQGSARAQITPFSSSWWLCAPISDVPNHPAKAGAFTVTLRSQLLSQHQSHQQQQQEPPEPGIQTQFKSVNLLSAF